MRHFFYQSALGTRPGAKSEYHKTKWQAEELVRASGIAYTILRPSLIYGPGDQFTLRLAGIIRSSPVLPVIGSGRSKVQPIFIDDVVACIIKAVTSDAFLNEIYEVGGPEQLTYEEVTRAIAAAMGVEPAGASACRCSSCGPLPALFEIPAAEPADHDRAAAHARGRQYLQHPGYLRSLRQRADPLQRGVEAVYPVKI